MKLHSIIQEKKYAMFDYTAATKAEIFFSEVTEAGRG